jgi:hypothetical protein
MAMSNCKQACRWGVPAKLFDGPVMISREDVRKAIKRAPKGSPEKDRLEALMVNQARICWTCGKRVSVGEAAQLTHEAAFIDAQRR